MILQRLSLRSAKMESQRGFTLVELAIVLGVASLLFGGLWRLMSTGSAQLRDQSVADQHKQVVEAVAAYLKGPEGSGNLTGMNEGATSAVIDLPAAGTPCNNGSLSCYLPSGFDNTTVNAYGQTYSFVYKKDTGANGSLPQSYSFMVLTDGGDTIPDSSGARIASMIGNDGGFLYGADVCGTPVASFACGAYGAWRVNVADATAYNVAGSASGHVASRTHIGVRSAQTDSDWLGRKAWPAPTPTTAGKNLPEYNTMQTHMFLYNPAGGETNLFIGDNAIYGGNLYSSSATAPVGGGILGISKLSVGTITVPTNYEFVLAGAASFQSITNPVMPTLTIGGECATGGTLGLPACASGDMVGLQVNADGNINGQMQAAQFYAQLFLYESDEALKKEIEAIQDPLNKLSKIRGVSFFFKDEEKDKRKHYGVIAQEVEKVFPELVVEVNGKKTVDYPSFVGPLIAAVNELRERNDALSGQVQALKAKVEVLEGGAAKPDKAAKTVKSVQKNKP